MDSIGRLASGASAAMAYGAAQRATGQWRFDQPVSLIGIYRRRNAQWVRRLVDASLAEGWRTAWWALDEVAEELAEHTVGQGAGEKFPLFNAIIDDAVPDEGWLVAADDDVTFVRGSPVALVATCAAAGFALAQPAHAASSAHSHEITRSRRLSVARRTTFVEIGPLFVVDPSWRDRIVPFPSSRGMGWGLEIEWYRLFEQGCALGIVDAITVRHLGGIGTTYDAARLNERAMAELASYGAERWTDLQRTLETWRPWQRQPPWS